MMEKNLKKLYTCIYELHIYTHKCKKKSYDKPRQHSKKQRHYFVDKGPYSQSYGFSSSQYGCESWTIKKAESWGTDAFELRCRRRLLRVPWTARRSKGNQPWIFIARTDPQAEAPVLWPPDAKSQVIGTGPDAGKVWGQEVKGVTEDEIGGWMVSSAQWTWVWANSGS